MSCSNLSRYTDVQPATTDAPATEDATTADDIVRVSEAAASTLSAAQIWASEGELPVLFWYSEIKRRYFQIFSWI